MTSSSRNNASAASAAPNSPLRIVDGRRFWAVLIGIDAYPKDPLRGCVSDAINFFRFLTKRMSVPPNHIDLLLGTRNATPHPLPGVKCTSATRTNIVDTLLSLSTNSQIQYGDNILIYFAGHGAVYRCRDYTEYDFPADQGTIEALCPVDRNPIASDKDKRIPDICDRELSTILSEICRTRGHHITVILDCCHSAGATRMIPTPKPEELVRRAEKVDAPYAITDMFAAGEKRLKELKDGHGVLRYKPISAGDWTQESKKAYVLLAACKSYGLAKEVPGDGNAYHGVFTQALLQKLGEAAKVGELPTYVDLARHLTQISPDLYPEVNGDHRNMRLWFTV
ncbi:peptidase C14, caspase domain-containing protein [Armillaria novae-zelandiae]|uniref:Peptidase C14, caspase domain-containing protein n=1 Tax=Armillaria novae-zelandiae TaxID=153914 RepID=A0AA39UI41_9AGAR|nr:peptidase C14, caspase domain-containing protein [Armillaria novae-zelandiae]